MMVKPGPMPRPTRVAVPPSPVTMPVEIATVAVQIVASGYGTFCYYAKSAARDWVGDISAPTKDLALLEVFQTVQVDLGEVKPIRFLISLSGRSRLWSHVAELAGAGCLVERAGFADVPLARAAHLGLTAALRERWSANRRLREVADTDPVINDVIVATDGSVRGSCVGYGWLTADGRYGLHGSYSSHTFQRNVLLAELWAIAAAARALRPHRLTVISDSTAALEVIDQWIAGQDNLPPGFSSIFHGKPSPLLKMRAHIYESRDRLRCRWVKGHSGEPLNEGADALARLASRYIRGDSGLTQSDYQHRAAGLARSFAVAFEGRCA